MELLNEKGEVLKAHKVKAEDVLKEVQTLLESSVTIQPRNNYVLIKMVGEVSTMVLLGNKDGRSITFNSIVVEAVGDKVLNGETLLGRNVVLDNNMFSSELAVNYRVPSRYNKANLNEVKSLITSLKNSEYNKYYTDNPTTTIVDYLLIPEHYIVGINE